MEQSFNQLVRQAQGVQGRQGGGGEHDSMDRRWELGKIVDAIEQM